MAIVLMALLGFLAGFALDEAIARLAREPFEREDEDEGSDEAPPAFGAAHGLELGSETGSFDMPMALTSGAPYRRLLVIAVTAALFALIGWRYEGNAGHMLIVAAYVSALIVCTGTDVLAYRVPNVITYPAILAAILIGTVMPGADRTNVMLGGFVTGGVFLGMSILTRGGMGLGDVKLAFFTGFALGLMLGIPALLVTAVSGGVIAIVLMVTGIRSRKDPIPYAPFIALGALYMLLMQGTAFTDL